MLYSVTTISGPPLAVALSNQGLAKQEFRAALGIIRLAESSMTAVSACLCGPLFGPEHGAHPDRFFRASADRRAYRRAVDSSYPARDVPPDLYELRCVGGGAFGLSGLIRTLHLGEQRASRIRSSSPSSRSICGCVHRFFFVPGTRNTASCARRTGGGR
mgnify:CR=1 FL=1